MNINIILILFIAILLILLLFLIPKHKSLKVLGNIKTEQKSSDFTPYCYDYNDVGSSPYLRNPYKIKLYYADLSSNNNIQTGGIDLSQQKNSTVQIVNNTTQNPLHIFLQCGGTSTNQYWKKIDGDGSIAPKPVDWGSIDGKAFDPLGADIFQEVLIPKDKYLILGIPDGPLTKQGTMAARIFAIHMKNSSNDFLNITDTNPQTNLSLQKPILVEGGKDVVADMSAVDGINFKVRYELTSDNGKKMIMNILENPCDGIPSGGMDVGCQNPVKSECGTGAVTCDCKAATQNCKFNDCSNALFNIPSNLQQYKSNYDGGDSNGKPVKSFINNSVNLKDGSNLKKFCNSIQSDYKQSNQPSSPPPSPPPSPPAPPPSPPPSPPPPSPPPPPIAKNCPTNCGNNPQCSRDAENMCPNNKPCPPNNGCPFQCCGTGLSDIKQVKSKSQYNNIYFWLILILVIFVITLVILLWIKNKKRI